MKKKERRTKVYQSEHSKKIDLQRITRALIGELMDKNYTLKDLLNIGEYFVALASSTIAAGRTLKRPSPLSGLEALKEIEECIAACGEDQKYCPAYWKDEAGKELR